MKKLKFIDIVILLAVAIALFVGFLTYKHFRQTADKQIESTSKISFQVYLRSVTLTSGENPIKTGDDTFLSIRNVPYTALKIVAVNSEPKQAIVPSTGSQKYILVDDYSLKNTYDIIVTVEDTAKITKDGAVVGGNKVKIGLPITLEGKLYKFNGTVSNVEIMSGDKSKDVK